MKSLSLALAASVLLGGLALTPASAAVTAPAPAVAGAESTVEHVAMRRHYHYHHMKRHDRHMRRHMRRHHMRSGNPNARNPSRPGYQQQLGNTTGGPRY
ncbi:hypothetical protein NS228_21850 [Methylobacterium indicum]|uniref:Uncharacterized protein n=1 Tax=Methylobacterium indicum TaxID=1775910 RepID=A0ABR5HGV4_9HYPH|nr:hypothetical protein [Methylobacterium indicum]KMO22363.1 hypothetical protein QR78_07205 [Methylobacterium indicum]KMO25899.1 hypothetical protein QR79_05265 [Methylobacterium indicum]KTS32149.1 hypothetical protein NS228_21850 [Methylobacterium indicum]KTS37895.1 hypothetical protein NS229_05300 [Methylobacterium indicum]KTS52298.1 hypothetical protein NS230_10515 [Methylobacterium indicum]